MYRMYNDMASETDLVDKILQEEVDDTLAYPERRTPPKTEFTLPDIGSQWKHDTAVFPDESAAREQWKWDPAEPLMPKQQDVEHFPGFVPYSNSDASFQPDEDIPNSQMRDLQKGYNFNAWAVQQAAVAAMVQIGKDPTDPAHWTQIAQQIAFCSSMKPEEDKTPLHRDTRQRAYHENIEGKGTDKSRKRRKVRSKDAVYVEKFAEEAALSNDCAAILDEYRVKNHMPELKDVQCHIIEFAYNQFGSRLLQEKLDTASEEEKAIIYDILLESKEFNRLMKDGFGNYVLQRMFENGSANQHLAIVDRLAGNVFDYATHPYGCRVIQKGLECVTVDQQIRLVKDLQSPKNVLTCVQNQNGNHVIQKCIERMPVEHIQFVVDALQGHAEELAQNAFGCRVLQRLIEHCTDAEKVSPLLDEILRSVDQMAQDQYGNYVLQHILEHGVEDNRQTIMNVITSNILELSCHKFSSNVVESAILRCSTDESIRVSQAIMGDPSDTNPPLLTMMRDRYGNYIIQRLLESSLSSHREALLHRLKDQLHQLRKFTYSKHIVQVVEDWLRENPNVTIMKRGLRVTKVF